MPKNQTVVLDYKGLIQQGVSDAKGSENALDLLTEQDLLNLGKMLADREAKIGDLFSVVAEPINNIATAIEKGGYTSVHDHITEVTVPLPEASGAKRIYFVPVTEDVQTGDEEAYVAKFGLTLCKQAPNYLVGAMAILPESKLPANLRGKNFVAAENAESSVFRAQNGFRCFLNVCHDDDERELRVVNLGGCWNGDIDYWVFLAEKL